MTDGEFLKRYGHIGCKTLSYGAWNSGTRTIYETKIPLWEETVRSGHPSLGSQSPARFTAWPSHLPERLPIGAVKMDDSDPYFGAWVDFGANEIAAFEFCESLKPVPAP